MPRERRAPVLELTALPEALCLAEQRRAASTWRLTARRQDDRLRCRGHLRRATRPRRQNRRVRACSTPRKARVREQHREPLRRRF